MNFNLHQQQGHNTKLYPFLVRCTDCLGSAKCWPLGQVSRPCGPPDGSKKIMIILLTQNALGQFGWETGITKWGGLFSQKLMVRCRPDFFKGREHFESVSCKKIERVSLAWAKKKYIPKSRSPNFANFRF